jgi:Putative DNA-binding domain
MESRSDQIRSRGVEYIAQVVADHEEETLHLEFKTLSHSGGELKRDDRKMIAQAVAGLANAEGGLLIIGIETNRKEGVDVAVAKRPVSQLNRTTNLIRSLISEMLSPQHPEIVVFSVNEIETDDEGFIVIDVPTSSDRPHYSNVHHQYFRRGSDRTRVMEHGEIRELMFSARHGSLEVRTSARWTMSTGNRFGFSVILSVANVGRLPIRAPYLKVSPGRGWGPVTVGLLDIRQFRHNTTGFYAKTDQLVHVDDEFHLAQRSTGLELKTQGDRSEIIQKIKETRDDRLFLVGGAREPAPNDELFGPLEVTCGAENVLPRGTTLELSKWDMFEMMAENILVNS